MEKTNFDKLFNEQYRDAIDQESLKITDQEAEEQFLESRLRNFLTLSELEKEFLKKRIEQNKGMIRIFVHPFYEEMGGRAEEHEKRLESINRALTQMLLLSPDKTPPLFFFEEQDEIKKFKNRLREMKDVLNIAYVVPTYKDSSEPKLTPPDTPLQEEPKDDKENWNTIIVKLKELGTKKILIGGMWLDIRKGYKEIGENPEEVKLLHCVGNAINKLSNDFEIEISNLTFPAGRKELKNSDN